MTEDLMTSDKLALILLAAFWAGTSAVISGMNLMNDARDRILLGTMETEKLSRQHRLQLLCYDWVPMRIGLGAVSIILAFIIIMLPWLANRDTLNHRFLWVCYVTALVPLGGTLYFLFLGIIEYRLIRRTLEDS